MSDLHLPLSIRSIEIAKKMLEILKDLYLEEASEE